MAHPSSTEPLSRLRLERWDAPTPADGTDVRAGLQSLPKTLPAKYLYDERGSQLFERICRLPEYYPTRTEAAILQRVAPALPGWTGPCELVELGSGSSTKTRILLNAYAHQGVTLHYVPVDISAPMLETTACDLVAAYPRLKIRAIAGTYEQAFAALGAPSLPTRLLCFLGSTLGNFTPGEARAFFAQVSQSLAPGDFFLLGVDLQKDPAVLERAYNDAAGVTAAFNLNVLAHLNRRFAGNFDLAQFRHRAIYNRTEHQIEMHLDSQSPQTVTLHLGDRPYTFALAAGESIRTEVSRKFALDALGRELAPHGLQVQHTFTDDRLWFGLVLAQRCGKRQPYDV
ncbi:MAG: L-histidine N(alpha)-methyltransferase [Pseudanabaenaceae cyanobacterium]